MTTELTAAERHEVEVVWQDPSRRVGPYVLLSELGRGGVGVVYKAFDTAHKRLVAIKRLLETSERRLARFEREFRLTEHLEHPNIASMYEMVLEGPGAPYLVMQFVRGVPLHDLCAQSLPPERAARYVLGIALALSEAHEQGVIHRDIKPGNIIITPQDQSVVLDFGLAKQETADGEEGGLTQTGSILGTPGYLAPEQIGAAKQAGPPADVYALGATLYECLTTRPPFIGESTMQIMRAIREERPVPPSRRVEGVDPELDAICLRCLQKKPNARFPDAGALAEALQRYLDPDLISNEASRSKPPWVLVVGVLGLLAIGGGIALGTGAILDREPQPEVAEASDEQQVDDPPPATPAKTEIPVEPPPPKTGTQQPPKTDRPSPTSPETTAEIERMKDEATALRKAGKKKEAIDLLGKAIALTPNDERLYGMRGFSKYLIRDYRGAVADYTTAIRLAPALHIHWFNRGVNRFFLKDFKRAIADFDQAIDRDSDHASSWFQRGRCYSRLGKHRRAIRDYVRCVQRDSKHVRALKGLGYCRFTIRDYRGAVRAYSKAIEVEPDQATHYINRGFNLAKQGKHKSALKDYDRALERGGASDASLFTNRAFTWYRMGRYPEAIADLERSLQMEEDKGTRARLEMVRRKQREKAGH